MARVAERAKICWVETQMRMRRDRLDVVDMLGFGRAPPALRFDG
jgi:hypothetical protein